MPVTKTKNNPPDVDQGQSQKEIIVTHMNADYDALASMIAAKKLYPEAALVFPGSQEKNLRNFFLNSTFYLFNFVRLKQIDLEQVKRLILVDTRQKNRIKQFLKLADRNDVEIHIYDHHPDSEDDLHGQVEFIQPVGATTTILIDILRSKGISLSPDEATIMSLGIHEDTGSFTFGSTKPADYRAAAWLLEQGANHNLIADMLTRELTAEHIWLLNDLTKSARTYIIYDVEIVIAKVTSDEYFDDFAMLVHKFMEMENLNVIFALAQMGDKIYLVARSRIKEVNAADIALAFGGGGHPQAASASVKNKTLIEMERALLGLLRNRIIPPKKARDMMSSPVISVDPEQTLQEAAITMTHYNINVLLVIDAKNVLMGYITRQIVEKAVYFELGSIPVKEYMHIEFASVSPDAGLREVQDLIIKNKIRILPVVDHAKVMGVITRTDLLNILVGGPIIPVPDFLYGSRRAARINRSKNLSVLLKERLPRRVIELLKEFGKTADALGYHVYLVGGLVRDLFLKRENLDVDIVVEGDGIHFAEEFAKNQQIKLRSHYKFGTVILIFPDGFKVDVATARIEYYESPAALPNVEESSLKMDLYRRDFTINTLAVKLNKAEFGQLVDYFGAQKDLKDKVIRVLHNLSFVEDPTRVLRAIRFEQRFGFKIEKLTLSLIKNAVNINCFKALSSRRFFLELKLLLMEHEPLLAIERLNESDLLQFVSPEIKWTKGKKGLLEEIKAVISWFDHLYLEEPYEPWKVYWHGLTSNLNPKTLQQVAEHMQITDQKGPKSLTQMAAVDETLEKLYKFSGSDHYALFKLLSQFDTDILLFMMAKAKNKSCKRYISIYFTRLKNIRGFLKGQDLKKLGFQPGILYKQIFETVLQARLNQVINTKEDELQFIIKKFGNALVNHV